MTTSNANTTSARSSHERLVAGTLALLPARREGLEHLRSKHPRTRSPEESATYVTPADQPSHQELLAVIGEALEGSLVSAESRTRIMAGARELGVRPFDASLMIALAQDRARRGESLEDIPAMMSTGARTDSGNAATAPWLGIWLAVAASGVLLAHFAVNWMMR